MTSRSAARVSAGDQPFLGYTKAASAEERLRSGGPYVDEPAFFTMCDPKAVALSRRGTASVILITQRPALEGPSPRALPRHAAP